MTAYNLDPQSRGLAVARGVVCSTSKPRKKRCFGIGESSGEIEIFTGEIREILICVALCSVEPTSGRSRGIFLCFALRSVEPTSGRPPPACMVDTNHELQNRSSVPVCSWNVHVNYRLLFLYRLLVQQYSIPSSIKYQIQVVHLFWLYTGKKRNERPLVKPTFFFLAGIFFDVRT